MTDFIEEAIRESGTQLEATPAEDGKYVCVFTSPQGRMERHITLKEGKGAPALGPLLYHYALVCQYLDEYDDIIDWANEEGRDLNDPANMREFDQMLEDQKELRLLLGEPVYQKMMSGLAISQAINNARPR